MGWTVHREVYTVKSGCVSDTERWSSAAAGEERSDEPDVGWSDLLGGGAITADLDGRKQLQLRRQRTTLLQRKAKLPDMSQCDGVADH
jgi:hypothetical protein